MPGHVGRMRPIERHNSANGAGLDFSVMSYGRPGAGIPYSFHHESASPCVVSFRRLITPIPWGKLGFDFNITPLEMPGPTDKQVFEDRPSTSNGKGVEASYEQLGHVKNVDDIFQQDEHSSSEGSSSRDYPTGRGVYSREEMLGTRSF
jgi:hypothetical protein